ncbi:hypothetical protein HXX76_012176 [Chlamydomonas incerta]|uniref:Uncharacterized protein n=1 Tax=Chlamydomonas incerta TaxID=51695 RepID=A0A835VWM3_CHLIN|nr:hypothetical protein HXX76_012176 [Chlamydomonas incerta]|eukprot:KAG2427856.1 hypothetical protein HXX76_012176 [Chlamydomonas incerta]
MALEQLRQPAFTSLYQTHDDSHSHSLQQQQQQQQQQQPHGRSSAAGTDTLGGGGASGGAGAPFHAPAGGGGGGYSQQGHRSYSPQHPHPHPHQQQYDITPVGATAGTPAGGTSAAASRQGAGLGGKPASATASATAASAAAGGGGGSSFRHLAARYPRLHTGVLQWAWASLVWYVSTAAWLLGMPWRATRWLTPRFLQPPLQWAEDTGLALAAPPTRLAGDAAHGSLTLADRLLTGGGRALSSAHTANLHHWATAYEAYLWLLMHRAHAVERHGWEGLRRSLARRTV